MVQPQQEKKARVLSQHPNVKAALERRNGQGTVRMRQPRLRKIVYKPSNDSEDPSTIAYSSEELFPQRMNKIRIRAGILASGQSVEDTMRVIAFTIFDVLHQGAVDVSEMCGRKTVSHRDVVFACATKTGSPCYTVGESAFGAK